MATCSQQIVRTITSFLISTLTRQKWRVFVAAIITVMASMFDPQLNLGWAKKHLDFLKEQITPFEKSQAENLTLTAEDDLKNGMYVVTLKFPSDPEHQFAIALVAGDFISRLRSSLDHLAWQLAMLTTDKPSRNICFPVHEKDSLDTQLGIVKTTYGIPDEAVAVMKSFQPYHTGDMYKTSHLWRLQRLWNIDKHRHITPHGAATDWLFRTDSSPVPYPAQIEQLDDGIVMRIPLTAKDKVHLNPDPIKVAVRFDDRSEGLSMGIQDFFDMYQFVADTVFPAFARFFK